MSVCSVCEDRGWVVWRTRVTGGCDNHRLAKAPPFVVACSMHAPFCRFADPCELSDGRLLFPECGQPRPPKPTVAELLKELS